MASRGITSTIKKGKTQVKDKVEKEKQKKLILVGERNKVQEDKEETKEEEKKLEKSKEEEVRFEIDEIRKELK